MGTSVESEEYLFRTTELCLTPAAVHFLSLEPFLGQLSLDLDDISWVIVREESGPGAGPAEEAWVREIRDQCVEADVPFFFTQWGGPTPKAGGRTHDARLWDEMPNRAVALR